MPSPVYQVRRWKKPLLFPGMHNRAAGRVRRASVPSCPSFHHPNRLKSEVSTDLLSTCPRPGTWRSGRPGRTSSSSWWSHTHWMLGSCIQYYLGAEDERKNTLFFIVVVDGNDWCRAASRGIKNSFRCTLEAITWQINSTLCLKVSGFTSKWL